jgi:hypothetical protein
MNEAEYILRILLRARDQMSAVLAKARKEIAAFGEQTKKTNTDIDKLNSQITSLNTRIGNVTDKVAAWRAAMRDFGKDGETASRSARNVTKSAEQIAVASENAAKKQLTLSENVKELDKALKNLKRQFDFNRVSETDYIQSLDLLDKAFTRLGKDKKIDAKTFLNVQELQNSVRELKAVEQEVIKAREERLKALQAAQAKEIASEDQLASRLFKAAAARTAAIQDARDKEIAAIENAVERTRAALDKQRADELKAAQTQALAIDKERDKEIAARDKAIEAELRQLGEQAELEKRVIEARKRLQEIEESQRLDNRPHGKAEDVTAEYEKQLASLRTLRTEFQRFSRAADDGSESERQFALETERVNTILRQSETAMRNHVRSVDSGRSAWRNMIEEFQKSGDSVASLDNRLRGIGILILVGFAQQLITVLIGLGGTLLAVAGSAAQAAGAIGGTLVAGIAQAIPAAGLLIAAFGRVGAVFDAVKQQQQLQEALFREQARGTGEAADNADRLANAQDSIRAANDSYRDSQQRLQESVTNLADAQQELNRARADARSEIEGLNLSEREAEENLRRLIVTGASQLEIERAQLELRRRRADADRQTRGGGIDNLDSVVAATERVEQAEQSLRDAKESAEESERGITRAQRGLESARRQGVEAAGATVTAQANLQYLLSQLSPAERRLFEAVNRIQATYRRVFIGEGERGSGILGIIITAFAGAVDRVNEIIQMPRVISTLENLATTISDQFTRIFDAFTTQPMIDQLLGIAEAGRQNLPEIADILITLGKAFFNIAEAAAPALELMIDFIGDLADKFLGLTENQDSLEDFFTTGEEHFESWVNLLLALVGLFAAFTGAGGAEEGKKTIDDLTDSINEFADKVASNEDKVHSFFENMRFVAHEVGRVLVALGKELGASFDPGGTRNFADVLIEVVIPALGMVLRSLGSVVDQINKIVENPVAREIAKWVTVLLIATQLFRSIFSAFAFFVTTVQAVFGIFATLGRGIIGTLQGITRMDNIFGKLARSVLGVEAGASRMSVALNALKFAGIVGTIGFILERLGLLDDLLRAVGGFFTSAFDQIRPPLERLFDSVDRLYNAFAEGEGIIGPIIDLLRFLARTIIRVLTPVLSDLGRFVGQIFGGIIDVIGGAIDIVVGLLTGDWALAWEGAKDIVRGFGNVLIALPRLIVSLLRRAIEAGTRASYNVGRAIARGFRDGFLTLAEFFAGIAEWLQEHVLDPILEFFGIKSPSTVFKRVGKNIAQGFVDGFLAIPELLLDAIVTIADALFDVGKSIGQFIYNGIKSVLQDIGEELGVGKGGGLLGLGGIDKFGDFFIPDALRKAEGGPIPGYGGGDRRLTLLEDGEHVITKEEVRAAGGHPIIFAIRRMLGGGKQASGIGMQDGGAVDRGVSGVLTIAFQGQSMDQFRAGWRELWLELTVRARRASTDIEERTNKLYRRMRRSFEDISDVVDRFSLRFERNIRRSINDVQKTIFDGMQYIARATNRAMRALDEDPVDFNIPRPGGERRAVGGVVGGQWGQRGKDTILTWLGKGEAVLNHWQQRAVNALLPGQNTIGTVLDRISGYHAGGPEQLGYARGRKGSGNDIVPVPGFPGEQAARKVLDEIRHYTSGKFRSLLLSDAYGPGHQSPGHTVYGTAADIAGPDSVMNSAAADMVRKGYKVLYDGRFGTIAWPGHGPSTVAGNNAHIHVEFGVIDRLLKTVKDVARVMVRGPEGPMRNIMQGSLDLIRKGANNFIESLTPTFDGEGQEYINVEGAGSVGKTLVRVWKAMGLPFKALLSAFETGIVESGMQNLPGGDADSQGWRQERSSLYPDPMNVVRSAQRFFNEWRQFNNPALSAGEVAANVQRPAAQYRGRYDQVRAQALSLLRSLGIDIPKNLQFAKGGIVPGGDGTPVGVLAHAGEWILNKFQQSRLAGLLGTGPKALASMLGFHGGPTSFQGGGEINIPDLPTNSFAPLRVINRDIEKILGQLPDVREFTGKFIKLLDSVSREEGFFDRLRTTIERRSARRERRLVAAEFDLEPIFEPLNALQRMSKFMRAAFGRSGVPTGRTEVVRQLNDIQVAQRQLRILINERSDLTKEVRSIRQSLRQAQRVLRSDDLTDKQRDKVQAQVNNLRARMDEASTRVAENVQSIFQAQEAVLEAQIARQQEVVDNIRNKFQRQESFVDLSRRVAQALGQDGIVAQLNTQSRFILDRQATALQNRIDNARGAGANELADELELEVAEIRAQIQESLAQELRDTVDRINNNAQRALGQQDIARRILSALGRGTTAIDNARLAIMRNQQDELLAQLQAAQAQGNVGLANEISDQIAELGASIVELTQQMFQEAIEEVNETAQRRIGRLDLANRLLEATGSVGLTAGAVLGGETFSRSGIFQQRGAALEAQRSGLQTLLRNQQQLPVDQQNIEAIQELIDQILELDVTIQENTRAAFQARVEDVNRVADFSLSISDLNRQIIELEGEIAGNTNQAAILGTLQSRQQTLEQQRINLEQLLLEAQNAQDQQAVNDLTVAILQNRVALLQNTKTMNELSGVFVEPQTFTSTAWRLFREAIFNGLGEILPQYQISVPVPTDAAMQAGVYTTSSNSSVTTNQPQTVTTIEQNFEINEAGGPIDINELGAVTAFAAKNAQ